MQPTYGVITATLNAVDSVERAIDSVLAQSVPPKEYVFVDGGSTDGTLEAIARGVQSARRLGLRTQFRTLQQRSAEGIAGAWNDGVATLSSDVVFLLNADDWYEPSTAVNVLRAFAESPEAGIVHGKSRFHRHDGTTVGICAPNWINRFGLQCRTVHCATFVRREVYTSVGGFNPRYRTTLDFDFLERCHAAGVEFRYVDEILGNFRLGGVSNSQRHRADWETLLIGLRHSRTKVPPVAAFLVRRLVMRPLGLAGFDLRLRREPVRGRVPELRSRELRTIEPAVGTAVNTSVKPAR